MDEASEIAEGRKAHQQVLAEYGTYANPQLQAYVDRVGQNLARLSHRSRLPWTFTVVDSPEINAFALPGGYVYITRGLMAYLDNEAELAAVVGHEIGHVTARHGAQRATRQQDAGLGVLAATVLGAVLESQGVGGAASAAGQMSQGVAAGWLASYSREQELQADELGAEYLVRNRYDPGNMVAVIGALKDQERFAADVARAEGRAPPAGANWLSSHPSNDQRLADIRRFAAGYQGDYGDDGRTRYLQVIDGMSFGESRTQGVTRGRNFFHEELGIALTAPRGWRIRNTPEAITVVNEAGDAGLIVRLVPPQAGNTHDEIIRKLIRPTEGRVERGTLQGLAATQFSGARRNDRGQTEAVRVLLVSGPGNRNYLLNYGARDTAALQRAAVGLAEAQGSFRPLNASERAAARPWVLKTAPYPRGGFAELARSSPLGPNAEAQLRLLNSSYASGTEPRPGQPVKVVR
ncbi:MAG: peptidase [Betaproteobacteria bacterium HGW-Betaproteobacteria-19]|nr:MAG: peptidase [Betaproteobacteria bacterium HGW-Betaproteobacteria-19]